MEQFPGNAEKGRGLRLASSILACAAWGLVFLIPLIGLAFLFLWNRNSAGGNPRD